MKIHGKYIDQVISLKLLHTAYKDHKRLRVFHHKGAICVCCGAGKEGVYLVKNHTKTKSGKIGSQHVDVFTKKWVLMTVDHIIPLVEGGTWDIENLQPMCSKCNSKKAHHIITVEELQFKLGIYPKPYSYPQFDQK